MYFNALDAGMTRPLNFAASFVRYGMQRFSSATSNLSKVRYIVLVHTQTSGMRRHKSLSITRLGLIFVWAGAILFLGPGCDPETATDREPAGANADADHDAAGKKTAASKQAAAVFDASFHKLEDWNQMQSLSKWRGQYLVLNFWATWCKSCHHEVPELNKLYNQFKDKNTVVVGLAVDNADKVKDYAAKYGVDYPILVGGNEALELSKKMGNKVVGLPFTIMITPQGEVVETILGATEKGTLPKVLTPHLM
ncbi:MAG: TlpA disulfide reductase family protein [Gammaproteobacteria bacterium]